MKYCMNCKNSKGIIQLFVCFADDTVWIREMNLAIPLERLVSIHKTQEQKHLL